MKAITNSLASKKYFWELFSILVLVLLIFAGNSKAYVCNQEAENRRNARQDPAYSDVYYNDQMLDEDLNRTDICNDYYDNYIDDYRYNSSCKDNAKELEKRNYSYNKEKQERLNERQDPDNDDWRYNEEKQERLNERQDPDNEDFRYNKEKQERLNERQDPDNKDFRYNKEKQEKLNKRQDPDNEDFRYNKSAEEKRNEKQKPKYALPPDAYPPQRTPFIDRYVKDYSRVRTREPFTQMYVKDYTGIENNEPFTDRYVRDYTENNYSDRLNNKNYHGDRYLKDYSDYSYYSQEYQGWYDW